MPISITKYDSMNACCLSLHMQNCTSRLKIFLSFDVANKSVSGTFISCAPKITSTTNKKDNDFSSFKNGLWFHIVSRRGLSYCYSYSTLLWEII